MKLLLTSAGLTTPEMTNACIELCNKSQNKIKVAIINEAYAVEQGDKRWIIEEIDKIAKTFLGDLDFVNLLALSPPQIKERMKPIDLIWVLGGHTDYLMHVFEKSGFAKLLPELLKTKVYIGSSAGSMVLCKRVATKTYQQTFDEGDTYGTKRYMELVDFAMKPHFNSSHFVPRRNEQLLQKASQGYDGLIYCPEDTQAIMVKGEQVSFIGGKPFCVRGGEVV